MPILDFYHSQLSLDTYRFCQLRFRRRYLDGLYWPRPAGDIMQLGADFHLAARRYFTAGHMPAYEGQLGDWLELLRRYRLFTGDAQFLPEQELRLIQGDIKLVAKYDLLMLADKAYIYDWKTDQKRLVKTRLSASLQTVVYRYLLARAGSGYWGRPIAPADIIMIYWNPNHPGNSVVLPYSQKQMNKDEALLTGLIHEITEKPYESFTATADERLCPYCEYSPLCHGVPAIAMEEEGTLDLALSWDDIEEFSS
ncbi:MAG: PD-(D/E)XK nuclease family protein [Chitinophagales bacterium]